MKQIKVLFFKNNKLSLRFANKAHETKIKKQRNKNLDVFSIINICLKVYLTYLC